MFRPFCSHFAGFKSPKLDLAKKCTKLGQNGIRNNIIILAHIIIICRFLNSLQF